MNLSPAATTTFLPYLAACGIENHNLERFVSGQLDSQCLPSLQRVGEQGHILTPIRPYNTH